jgi:hypothetical protein
MGPTKSARREIGVFIGNIKNTCTEKGKYQKIG